MRLCDYRGVSAQNIFCLCVSVFVSFVLSKESGIQQDHCKKDNNESDCKTEADKFPKCIELNDKNLGPEDPSWFIIVPQGRLGNHIVGYSVIQALGATLNVRPLINEETETYLKQYFDVKHNLSIYENTFCNTKEIERYKMTYFTGSIDEIVEQKKYHK